MRLLAEQGTGDVLRAASIGTVGTCSAKNRTPLSRSTSKVSPSSGLNGFHVRSMHPYGPIAKPRTRANLHSCRRAVEAQQIWEVAEQTGFRSHPRQEMFAALDGSSSASKHRQVMLSNTTDRIPCKSKHKCCSLCFTQPQDLSSYCPWQRVHLSYWSSVCAAVSKCSVYSMISASRCSIVNGSMIHTGSDTRLVMSMPM